MNKNSEDISQSFTMCLKLRNLRKEFKLSQVQAAQIYNVYQPVISSIELCKAIPSIEQVLTAYYSFCPLESLSEFLDNEWLNALLHTRFKPLNPTIYYFKNIDNLKKAILRICKQYPNKAFNLEEIIALNKQYFEANVFVPIIEVQPQNIKIITRIYPKEFNAKSPLL